MMRVRPLGTAAVIGCLSALMGCSVAAFWPVYGTADFVAMAVGAIAAGAAVAVAGALRRWTSFVTASVGAAVLLALGVPLAVPGEALWRVLPSAGGFLHLLAGLGLGWSQLLTIALPVGSYQALLAPAYALAFGATLASVTLALRSRMPELAVVPALGVFAAAIVLGSAAVATPAPLVVAVIALSILWLAWMRRRRRDARLAALGGEAAGGTRRSMRSLAAARTTGIAALTLSLAVVAGAGAAAGLPPSTSRTVARSVTTPPFDPRDYPSPLSGFRSYLEPAESSRPLFTVRGAGDLTRVRVAVLDTYDGVVYSVGARPSGSGAFARVPDALRAPEPPAGSAPRSRRTLDIRIDGLEGPWLPMFGDLERIDFSGRHADALHEGFYYNAATATMADLVPLGDGESYRVTAAVTQSKTIAQLARARPGGARLPSLDALPGRLVGALSDFESDTGTPGARLSAALRRLAGSGYVSHGLHGEPVSLSGHGADRIDALLTGRPMVGDQEQYAVAAALLARRAGFPARVVLGFAVPRTARGGAATITGADVTAWVQVQTARDGWVDVDPNPRVRPIPEKAPEKPKQISRPQSVLQPPKDDADRDQGPPPQSHAAQQRDDRVPAWLSILVGVLTVLGWVALGLALAASPFLAVIAAKWRRRRLRRSWRVRPRGRISGAWCEFADRALDHGYSPPPAATRSEIAEAVGGPRSTALAALADRSAFSLADPSQDDAERIWRVVDELCRDLDAGASRWRRLRARVSLRSLGGYRGSVRGEGAATKRRSG